MECIAVIGTPGFVAPTSLGFGSGTHPRQR